MLDKKSTQDKKHKTEASQLTNAIWDFLVHQSKIKEYNVLNYCFRFLQDISTLLYCIDGTNIRLAGFTSNDALEFYFDLYQGKRTLGYISKGWDDPGVRLGDILYVDIHHLLIFKHNIDKILDACCSQGIAFYFRTHKGRIEIELWTPLYMDALPPPWTP